jgi:hypothetical protein
MKMLRDVLGDRATVELTEELLTLSEQLKVLGWRDVRPWGEFFGGFKVPELNAKSLEDRALTNLLHYRSNYAVIFGVLLLLQVFLSPMLLLSVPLAVIFCCYILVVHKRPNKIGDIKIRESHKQTACAILCLFFFAVTGVLERLVWIVIYSAFTIGLHLVMRPRNLNAKANKVYEEMKLNGYMDWLGGGNGKPTTGMDHLDPENPAERDPEHTRTHYASAGAPYGVSSNLGGSSGGAVDMRKRGNHPAFGSGPSAGAQPVKGSSPKND